MMLGGGDRFLSILTFYTLKKLKNFKKIQALTFFAKNINKRHIYV